MAKTHTLFFKVKQKAFARYALTYDSGLMCMQSHIPRRPSGSASRVAIGIGGGIVGEGVGATGRMIHIISE